MYAAFVMLIGLGVIGYSHRRHRERQLIRNTPRAEIESMAVGAVELAAEANPPVTPDADAADLVVTDDADTELFLVSDKAESALVEDRQYSLILGGLLGVGIFSVGLWWLLSVTGV